VGLEGRRGRWTFERFHLRRKFHRKLIDSRGRLLLQVAVVRPLAVVQTPSGAAVSILFTVAILT
jgi:hypothetical protein